MWRCIKAIIIGVKHMLLVIWHTGELDELICLYFAICVRQKEEQQLGSETGSSSEDQLSETELGIEELQLLLQAMQFRRFVTTAVISIINGN